MEEPASTQSARLLSRVGSVLKGKYVIERLVGAGGMAAVYRARHRNGHTVAIKILHQALSLDDDMRQRFRREALLANRVDHPGAVRVLDDDVTDDGCAFLVMPLLRGETLRAKWERDGRRLATRDVLVVAHHLLDVLAAAHDQRVVHRDVKPENLFVTDDGELRVLDFGVARLLEVSESPWATATGNAIGTPAFMAPEQALGRSQEIDERSDLWAVGATMFTCLSGRYVHEGASRSELLVHAATRPAPRLDAVVPGVHEALAQAVDRALAFEKADRWSSAREMHEAVRGAFEALGCRPPLDGARLAVTRPPDEPEDPTVAAAGIHDLPTAKPVMARVATPGLAKVAGSTRWRRAVWIGAAVALLGATLVSARQLAAPSMGTKAVQPSTSGSPHAPAADAAQAVAASRRAWRDADLVRARDEARRAAALDDAWAELHMAALVAMPFWPDDETRAEFVRAQELRDQLLPGEREMLTALAPAITVPPGFRRSAEMLDELLARSPDDLALRITTADMWFRIGVLDRAQAVLAPAASEDEPAAIALSELGAAQSSADRIDDARATFVRCTERYPSAQACSQQLSWIELLEGHCTEAERIVRREVSVSPSAGGYMRLADALWGQGQSPAELRSALDKWAGLSGGTARQLNQIRADQRFALLTGNLDEALQADAKLASALAAVDDDAERFKYTLDSMVLKVEAGRRDNAIATLESYVDSRNGLRQTSYGGDNVMYLQAVGTGLLLVPWPTWSSLRDARLARGAERDVMVDGLARTWLEYYAMPSTSSAAAREALSVLPKYPAILNRGERKFWDDAAIGRVYALAGQPSDAVTYFERAANTCTGLEDLIQYSHVLLDYAALLERKGEVRRACALYARAAKSLPLGTRSESYRLAHEKRERICAAR